MSLEENKEISQNKEEEEKNNNDELPESKDNIERNDSKTSTAFLIIQNDNDNEKDSDNNNNDNDNDNVNDNNNNDNNDNVNDNDNNDNNDNKQTNNELKNNTTYTDTTISTLTLKKDENEYQNNNNILNQLNNQNKENKNNDKEITKNENKKPKQNFYQKTKTWVSNIWGNVKNYDYSKYNIFKKVEMEDCLDAHGNHIKRPKNRKKELKKKVEDNEDFKKYNNLNYDRYFLSSNSNVFAGYPF